MRLSFTCTARPQGLMALDVERIRNIMKSGGLCILPSDSSYILTGLLTKPGVSRDLDNILERHGMEISLAFSSLVQCAEMIELSNKAHNFIRRLVPGGLTFVAHPRDKALIRLSTRHLYADGTIGVRLTESLVETQLVKSFLPSTPIRNSDHMEIFTAKEAMGIISDRISTLKIDREIAVIDGAVPYPGRLSTVVKEEEHNGCWHIVVLREGAIPINIIKKIAFECQYESVIVR